MAMNIKNIVKVMNFHALVRVDAAKRRAMKYMQLSDELYGMLDQIMNNRNLALDKSIMRPDPKKPPLTIYIGSDYGFCANYNSLVNACLQADPGEKIVIGKKLRVPREGLVLRFVKDDFEENLPRLEQLIDRAITERENSSINIVYHRYINSTTSELEQRQIYPIDVPAGSRDSYRDDFLVEGDLSEILKGVVLTYVIYQVELSNISGYASENVMRQNTTQESLKKIEEREEEDLMEERRIRRSEEFKKVIENYTKKKSGSLGA
ncbi:MAG: F0F1 ATP synthase subunit gamma [Lachnospiraceae bacterium]|nr:F0F1 ATP synthase subunit gamma [Lachnospiraceae bacterium]